MYQLFSYNIICCPEIEPKQLAFSAALGITIGIFPICGVTVLLCGMAIALLGSLCHAPTVLLANFVATPIELSLVVPFLRFGEVIYGGPNFPLTSDALKKVLTGQASHEVLLSIAHALLGWLVAAPFILAALYIIFFPFFKVMVRKFSPVPLSPKIHQNLLRKSGLRCPVCLGDYQAEDRLQQIPACGHTFHMECIDQWLANHTTCPLCRLSLIASAKVPSELPNNEAETRQDSSVAGNSDEISVQSGPTESFGESQSARHSEPGNEDSRLFITVLRKEDLNVLMWGENLEVRRMNLKSMRISDVFNPQHERDSGAKTVFTNPSVILLN
ncbi:hypothetical protein GH714_019958 [Hevea brasiliensis]|uniref:RING-type domain-containing protein n=1 Tax=Hevea brasiliensis TaxID=3981 RepID=A0A6A6L9M6_HEVBR|nr:hypothetical protein GH714_019958 [Hevea brasiliensis]